MRSTLPVNYIVFYQLKIWFIGPRVPVNCAHRTHRNDGESHSISMIPDIAIPTIIPVREASILTITMTYGGTLVPLLVDTVADVHVQPSDRSHRNDPQSANIHNQKPYSYDWPEIAFICYHNVYLDRTSLQNNKKCNNGGQVHKLKKYTS